VSVKEGDILSDSSEEELEKTLKEDPGKRTCTGFQIGFKLLPKKLPENILGTGTIGEIDPVLLIL